MKANLKGATGTVTCTLKSKTDMARLQIKLDNLNVDEFKTIPVDLSKLYNAVDNDVIKKTVYDKLVIKVSVIDAKIPNASGLATKTQHDSGRASS